MFRSDDDREAAYAGVDQDWCVRCETPGCDRAVSLPEVDAFCVDCRRRQALAANVLPFKPAAQCLVTDEDYQQHWSKAK